ncbi:MAG: PIN domain-containing protein [Allorhizobium sp.]
MVFRSCHAATKARVVPIHLRIACEAAAVVTDTGHKDPGDCYLIATARVKKLAVVTRDSVMLRLASPSQFNVIIC